jgi:Anti-sigma-28 factor, FlgM
MTDLCMEAATLADMGPPVDIIRVARLRTAIELEQYPIDPKRIARVLLALDDAVEPLQAAVKELTPVRLVWPDQQAHVTVRHRQGRPLG